MVYLVTSQTGFILLAIAAPLLIAIALRLPPRFRVLRVCMMTLLPVLGASLALALFNRASVWLAGRADADFWHLLFAGLAVAMIAIPLFLRRAPVLLTCLPFAGMIVVLLGWSAYLFPATVRENIKGIALNRPFCILQKTNIARVRYGYTPLRWWYARTREDFSYLTFAHNRSDLWIDNGSLPPPDDQNESVLPDGSSEAPIQGHDWLEEPMSFRRDAKESLPLNIPIDCLPRTDFLDAPGVSGDYELAGYNQLWLNDRPVGIEPMRLRIPADFMSNYDVAHGLAISSNPPDFEPVTRVESGEAETYTMQLAGIGLKGRPRDLRAYRNTQVYSTDIPAPDDGTEMKTMPLDGNGLHVKKIEKAAYYARYRSSGEWATAIRCLDQTCEHVFLPETPISALHGPIVFRYPAEMLSQWQSMEAKLESRFRGFVVAD